MCIAAFRFGDEFFKMPFLSIDLGSLEATESLSISMLTTFGSSDTIDWMPACGLLIAISLLSMIYTLFFSRRIASASAVLESGLAELKLRCDDVPD